MNKETVIALAREAGMSVNPGRDWRLDISATEISLERFAALVESRARAAEPEQEPVAWADDVGAVIPHSHKLFAPDLCERYTQPLYTAPTTRRPLTDEALYQIVRYGGYAKMEDFARLIERAHGIGDSNGS